MSTQMMKDQSSESRQTCLDGREAKGYGPANEVRELGLEEINHILADYFKTQPVVKAWIFGSFARGEDTPLSDIDILVVLDHSQPIGLKFFGMWNDLEKLLDRPVDLVTEGSLADFAIESVERDKILIYERAA